MNQLTTIGAFVLFVTFATGIWCLSQLQGHIDEEKIRREPSISSALKETPLPSRVLTAKGQKIRKIGMITTMSAFALFLAMFIAGLLRQP